MKTLGNIFGAILIIGSVLLFFVAFALSNRPNAPVGFIVILAVVSLVVGIALDYSADRTTCPQCAEKIKIKARVCRHCGHALT
jgi:predicted RNA-binding Zn-ribbon protein involved in translation (DUF1610 family)